MSLHPREKGGCFLTAVTFVPPGLAQACSRALAQRTAYTYFQASASVQLTLTESWREVFTSNLSMQCDGSPLREQEFFAATDWPRKRVSGLKKSSPARMMCPVLQTPLSGPEVKGSLWEHLGLSGFLSTHCPSNSAAELCCRIWWQVCIFSLLRSLALCSSPRFPRSGA